MRASMLVVLGVTATVVLGCGTNPASPPATPTDTQAAQGAYQQLKDAGKVFDCSTAYDVIMGDTGKAEFDVPALRDAAGAYRDINVKYADLLGKISFPPTAQPIADEYHRAVSTETNDLDWLTAVSAPKNSFAFIDRWLYDEAVVYEAYDRLKESLGHPMSQALRAMDLFEVARQTAQKDNQTISMLFEDAIAHSDLQAAKAVNRIEENSLQRYIDTLGTIDFPDSFDARVDDLKTKIRASIDFDKRQVDVASAAEIVEAPAEGSPESQAKAKAETELFDELQKLDKTQSTEPAADAKC
jgi:hypothetical protein